MTQQQRYSKLKQKKSYHFAYKISKMNKKKTHNNNKIMNKIKKNVFMAKWNA